MMVDNNIKKIKLLIVAENASFKQGGEAVLPLHYFIRLSKRGYKPYLLVHERVKSELDEGYPEYRDRIIYIKDAFLQILLYKVGHYLPRRINENTLGMLMVFITSIRQKYLIKKMVSNNLVNVIHQPTPVSPRQPSLIYDVNAPVIIGPMNGGMNYPESFQFMESKMVKMLVNLGRVMSSFINYMIPGKRKASLLLVSNKRTFNALPSSATKNVKIMVENGVDRAIWNTLKHSKVPEIAEFVYIGRLIDWKGLNYLLEAFANYHKNYKGKLTIIGDGPELLKLKVMAKNLDLDNVQFTGFLPQKKCAELLENSTALILPSLYECGGAVVLEAMSAGKAVIAVDWGGPSDYLDDKCGILISPKSPEYLVSELEKSMIFLSENTLESINMGEAGRKKVELLYDWDKKIDMIIEHYQSVLGSV